MPITPTPADIARVLALIEDESPHVVAFSAADRAALRMLLGAVDEVQRVNGYRLARVKVGWVIFNGYVPMRAYPTLAEAWAAACGEVAE
jgi:hypothetical protein